MKTIIIVLILFFTFNALSQDLKKDSIKGKNRITVNSYSLNMKPMVYTYYTADLYDLVNRMSKNQIDVDFPIDDHSQTISNIVLFSYNLEMGISARPNRELLIGLSYISGTRGEFALTKKNITRVDTTVVQGYKLYIDSFIYSHYNYWENTNDYGIGLTYLFKTDQNKMLSLFGGFGVNFAYSSTWEMETTTIKDSSYHFTTDEDPYNFVRNYQPDYWMDYSHSNGNLINKPSYFVRVFVPLGINWNISKKDDFWKHINVMLLAQFGLEYRNIMADMSYWKMYWGIGGLGFKYTF